MKFIKIPKKQAEKTRQELIAEGLIANEYPIIHEEDFVLIPVRDKWKNFEVVERDVEKRPAQHAKLKDALSEILTDEELDMLTTSFDIIGDIAVVEVPAEIEAKEKEIGKALLKVHKNLKTVLKKLGPLEGEYRVRKLQHMAGENRTETTYREHGCQMKLDLSKVYFSVRLATERKRISDIMGENERVLVLFAGVGPFALVIAKNHPDARITAVEINPDAVKYMKENAALNKANIEILKGDVRDFEYRNFDRVIMPLPKSAHEFLPTAFQAVKDGGTVYFYTIAGMKQPFKEAIEKAEKAAKATGITVKIQSQRIVRPYSPSQVQVVLDLIIRK